MFASGYITNSALLTHHAKVGGDRPPTTLAESIALAYGWFGDDLASHVLGQFCAAIVRLADRSVVLLQDSMGIRPLFYAARRDQLFFATRLVDVVSMIDPPEPDPAFLAGSLALGGLFTGRTSWRGIRRLSHGQGVRWRSARESRLPTWTPEHRTTPWKASDGELAEELLARLSNAVVGALPQDASSLKGSRGSDGDLAESPSGVWCELSAGLDSTSVLYVALMQRPSVEAFSFVSGRGLEGSDAEAIRRLVPMLPCPWNSIDTDGVMPFSAFPPEPHDEPTAAVSDAKRRAYESLLDVRDIRVVLTGLGGDQAFGSTDIDPLHLAEGLLELRFLRAVRDLRDWARDDTMARSPVFWLWSRALPDAWMRLRELARGADTGWRSRIPAWLRIDALLADMQDPSEDLPRLAASLPYGRAALWARAYSIASMASRDDHLAAADFRHPLLDRQLLEFALFLPYRLRNTVSHDRILQRAALTSVLPEQVRNRRVKGTSQAALDEGLRRSGAWQDLLFRAENLSQRGYLHMDRWREAVDRAKFGVYDSATHFFVAAELEAWLAYPPTFERPRLHLVHEN